MSEETFSNQAKDWASKIATKFGAKAGEQFVEVVEDLFESKEELLADLEVEEWDESALMDTLHSDKSVYKNAEMCITFYKTLQSIIEGKYCASSSLILLPNDIIWDVDEKDIITAQKYMNSQCPGGGFNTANENKNLFKIIAIGRKNEIELLTLIMDIYELAHIDELISKERNFKNETAWAAKCEFFKGQTIKNNTSNIIRRAIPEFKKRISGSGPMELIMNPIKDDINIYIKYILAFNNVIQNILQTDINICPLQIDLIILGKKNENIINQDDEKDEQYDDDDDDDDEAFMAKINASVNESGVIPLVNQLPKDGINGILKAKKIDFINVKIDLNSGAKMIRIIQENLMKKLGNNNSERLIVCIDRNGSGSGSGSDEKEEDINDNMFIYQLGNNKWDKIGSDYNEMHLSWKTKSSLIPNWKMNDDDLNPFIGASVDIDDQAFVFSYHIHSKNRVKCEQSIKSQKSPFLPYQFIEFWPMYFHKKYNKIDKELNQKYIYQNWALPTNDKRLMKWIQIVDPFFYKNLEKKHLKYVSK